MKEITVYDILVIGMFILILISRFCSIAFFYDVSQTTKADIEKVVEVYEANPLIKWSSYLTRISTMINLVVIPAALVALYIIFRKKVVEGKLPIDHLAFYTTFAFCAFAMYALNDAAFFLSKWL